MVSRQAPFGFRKLKTFFRASLEGFESTNYLWQKLFWKINSLFWRVFENFFPPNFPFPKYKRKIWREKFTLQRNEVHYLSVKILKGPTFFALLKNLFAQWIFFPPKFFLVFWKREIFLSKKNLAGKKLTEQKGYSISNNSYLWFRIQWSVKKLVTYLNFPGCRSLFISPPKSFSSISSWWNLNEPLSYFSLQYFTISRDLSTPIKVLEFSGSNGKRKSTVTSPEPHPMSRSESLPSFFHSNNFKRSFSKFSAKLRCKSLIFE